VAIPGPIDPFPKLLRAAGYYCSNNYKEDYNFKDPTIWDDSSQTAHWRNRAAGQPFFSVFNIMATHQSQINGSDEQFEAKYGSKLAPEERHDPRKMILPPYYPDTPMVRTMWARYYDLITLMDKQVGEILDQLEADYQTRSATGGGFVASYSVSDGTFSRAMQFKVEQDWIQAIEYWRNQVRMEEAAASLAKGLGNPRRFYARFT